MKRIAALLLSLIMVLASSSCAMNAMSTEEIPSFLDELADKTFSEYRGDMQLKQQFIKATKNKEFDSIVSSYLEQCSEVGQLKKCVNIAAILDYHDYDSESIKAQFYNCVAYERSSLFQERNNRLSNFLDILQTISHVTREYETHYYYLNILDFFPYEEMKTAITDNADLVICETGNNGFYDTNDGEVTDESYWWSPIDKERVTRGRVGVQKITKYNLFSGDFDVAMQEHVFYGTNPGDSGNDVYADLYYKGKWISDNYTQIDNFLSMCSTGNVFYWGSEESDDIFLIISNDKITVYNGTLFDIQYYS